MSRVLDTVCARACLVCVLRCPQKRVDGLVLFDRSSSGDGGWRSGGECGSSSAVEEKLAQPPAASRSKKGETAKSVAPTNLEGRGDGVSPRNQIYTHSDGSPGGLYERGIKQRAKREAAMARRKQEKEDLELKECTFGTLSAAAYATPCRWMPRACIHA